MLKTAEYKDPNYGLDSFYKMCILKCACFTLDFNNYINMCIVLNTNVDAFRFKWQKLNLLVSQDLPLKPGAHAQLRPFIKSVHVPPFRHGLISHSLISIKKNNRSYN